MQIFGFEIDNTWEQLAVSAGILFLFVVLAFVSRLVMGLALRLVAHRTKS